MQIGVSSCLVNQVAAINRWTPEPRGGNSLMSRPHLAAFSPALATLAVSITLTVLGGCHIGNFSASIDSDTRLPEFEFSAIPDQWEPNVDQGGVSRSETDGQADGAE